jgi:hypothetical protein
MLLKIKPKHSSRKIFLFDKESTKFFLEYNENIVFLLVSDAYDSDCSYLKVLFGGNLYYISDFFIEEVK